MATLRWQDYAVPQRRPRTGCIPTAYETILRAAGAKSIDFDSFQDEFDLDKDLPPGAKLRNHFVSVAKAIAAKYPHIRFVDRSFGKEESDAKLSFVEEQLAAGRLVLVSVSNAIFGGPGWHIMLVVESDAENLILLRRAMEHENHDLLKLAKSAFVAATSDSPAAAK